MKKWIVIAIVILLGVGAFGWWQGRNASAATEGDTTFLTNTTEVDIAAFAKATEPGNIVFPDDLGPHNDYQTEWWYYTGNLETADGRPFGYQLTFFRRALVPETAVVDGEDGSPWRTNQIYLAHFAVSDIGDEAFYPAERFSRGAVGLAGAQAVPYEVWLEDWYAKEIAPDVVQLFAETESVTLDLTLTQTLPPILQGDRGLSAKGPEVGNASYYYSFVQQATVGTITVNGTPYAVNGVSWKDHEYSSSILSEDVVGWDWFSIQFDDGRAMILYDLRKVDGQGTPFAGGNFIAADGALTPVKADEFEIEILDEWTSDATGATYPSAWRIRVPKLDLVLEGRPFIPNQEMLLSTTYWEGAVEFTGTIAGEPANARGYVELTGYTTSMAGRF